MYKNYLFYLYLTTSIIVKYSFYSVLGTIIFLIKSISNNFTYLDLLVTYLEF